MKNQQVQSYPSPAFRCLILSAVAAIFILVVLGGVVRVTGSGLGCPDWPLCHGRIIPPLDGHTLVEYSHRLMASLVGILVLITTVLAWMHYRKRRWVLIPVTVALVLVIIQGVLGGITVLTELEGRIVTAHLALAEAILAIMALASLATRRNFFVGKGYNWYKKGDIFRSLTLITALAAYVLLISGSYVAVSGASRACLGDWPLCQGQLWPSGRLDQLQVMHRFASIVVGILILWTGTLAWRRRESPELAWMSLIAGSLFVTQVFIGALIVWLGLPMAATALHLAMATILWMALVVLALLPHTSSGIIPETTDLGQDSLTTLRSAIT